MKRPGTITGERTVTSVSVKTTYKNVNKPITDREVTLSLERLSSPVQIKRVIVVSDGLCIVQLSCYSLYHAISVTILTHL